MYEKIGYYSVRYRYFVIAFWIVAVGLATWLAPNLNDLSISDQAGYLSEKEPSVRAMQMINKHFPNEIFSKSAILVLESKKGDLRDAEGMSIISGLTGWVKSSRDPKISKTLLSPVDPNLADRLISSDGSVALILVGINGSPDDGAVIKTLERLTAKMDHVPPGYKGYVTGAVSITNSYKISIMKSAEKTIIITIVLIIVCLLLIYRSPILPLVPLMIIGVAYGISRSLVAFLALHGLAISTMTDLFLVVLLFGAGTDYCLFIISRFKEFLADDMTGAGAATKTMARVGETIVSSAGTLIVADIAISFVSVKLFANTGPSLAIGLVVSLCAVMTLTPALLAIIGTRAFWPGKPKHASESAFWGRMGQWVTRMPWAPLALSIVVMVPLAFYGLGQKKTYDMLADLPGTDTAKAGYNLLAEKFGVGEMLPVDILTVKLKDIRKPSGLAKIAATTEALRKTPGVSDVRSLTSPGGKTPPVLRVDYQLNLIAGQIKELRGTLNDPRKARTVVSGAGGRFLSLKKYLDNLAVAFPGVAAGDDYKNAAASMDRLQKSYESSQQLLMVPGQLAEISERMKNFSGTDPEAVLPQLEMLQSYFAGLVTAHPAAGHLDGYAETMTALKGLHERFTALKGMNALTGKLSMIAHLKELRDNQTGLKQGLGRMKKDADVKLTRATYVPPVLPRETLEKFSPIQAELAVFQAAIVNLSFRFAKLPDAYYAPVELADGSMGEALAMLLNMYTTESGDAARYQVILTDHPFSPAAMDTIARIRSQKLPTEFYVGGNISILADLRDAMKRDTTLMWILVCGGIIIVLIFLLRSLVAPLYLMGTILLSYNATMGITRFVFEYMLGKEITWFVPFFMFVLLLALGMDYNIFLMGRVKEEVARHGTKKGVQRAVLYTGGIITSAGIIMAGTFAAVMSSDLLGLVQLSFAITIGVLQDTFITRTTLVPAIVVLLGEWNWWPGNLLRKKEVAVEAEEIEETVNEILVPDNAGAV